MKTWARCFVQDLFLKFKSYRDSTAEGYLTYEMTWHEMFDWIHNVVFKITLCMVYRTKQDLCQKGKLPYYATNFKEVGGAYCFWVVRPSVPHAF